MEDWTCRGQHKKQPEFPVVTRESRRNSRKTTWRPRHRKMKPFPATAPQEKSHVRNWRSKGHLAPLMRPTKFTEIPVSLERNTEVFRHPPLIFLVQRQDHRRRHAESFQRGDEYRDWQRQELRPRQVQRGETRDRRLGGVTLRDLTWQHNKT